MIYLVDANVLSEPTKQTADSRVVTWLNANHKDPFDRLLIAQSIEERLTIVTADAHFSSYPV